MAWRRSSCITSPGNIWSAFSTANSALDERRLGRARFFSRSLDDDAVGPLDEGNKNRGTAEFGSPLSQIVLRDPTGPAAGSSSKDGDFFGDGFFQCLAERRPADGKNGIGGGFAHQTSGFGE